MSLSRLSSRSAATRPRAVAAWSFDPTPASAYRAWRHAKRCWMNHDEEKADELVEPGAFGLQVERVAVAMGRTEVAGARGFFGGLVVVLVLEPLVGPACRTTAG